MRLRNVWFSALGIICAASLAACGGSSSSSSSTEAPAATPAGQKVDPTTAGGITGTVMVDGALPKNAPIKMDADPMCVKANKDPQFQETYMTSKDGKDLENVFVYVKDGLGNYVFDTPTTPVEINQMACRYHPHVFGIRVGQPLEIVNSDMTLHNIHALPMANTEFNTGQPIQGMKTTHTFDKKEIMVPFKCDVHGWMNAFVGVMDNPYFAVTGDDGKFEIKTLPPGTYTIEAWHEKLGTMDQMVTIGKNETKDISFTFKAPAAATN